MIETTRIKMGRRKSNGMSMERKMTGITKTGRLTAVWMLAIESFSMERKMLTVGRKTTRRRTWTGRT